MATKFVNSAAAGTGTGNDWTNAYTTLGAAITAVVAGDIIKVHYAHTEVIAGNVTYTPATNIRIVSVDKDNSDAFRAQGASGYIGHTGAQRNIAFTGNAINCYIRGLTLRLDGNFQQQININTGDGSVYTVEDCLLSMGNPHTLGHYITFGASSTTANTTTKLINTQWTVGNGYAYILVRGRLEIEGGGGAAGSSWMSPLFEIDTTNADRGEVYAHGVDFSTITSSTLLENSGNGPMVGVFTQCKFGTSMTLVAGGGANLSESSAVAYDCAVGDIQVSMWHQNALGSTTVSTSIYADDALGYDLAGNKCSWKVTLNSAALFSTPYRTPWMSVHNEGTLPVTPYLEVLRDGSTTPFTDIELWAELSYKGTSGFTNATIDVSDRAAMTATAGSNQATGAASWTGAGASTWKGNLAPAAAITPAEIGDIAMRVCFVPNTATIYVDPQIRGL